mgnify:FL=1
MHSDERRKAIADVLRAADALRALWGVRYPGEA